MKTIEVTKSTSLVDLVALANQESEIVITQNDKPVAKVLPVGALEKVREGKSKGRTLGLHPDAWKVSDDFDDPLPDEFWLGEK